MSGLLSQPALIAPAETSPLSSSAPPAPPGAPPGGPRFQSALEAESARTATAEGQQQSRSSQQAREALRRTQLHDADARHRPPSTTAAQGAGIAVSSDAPRESSATGPAATGADQAQPAGAAVSSAPTKSATGEPTGTQAAQAQDAPSQPTVASAVALLTAGAGLQGATSAAATTAAGATKAGSATASQLAAGTGIAGGASAPTFGTGPAPTASASTLAPATQSAPAAEGPNPAAPLLPAAQEGAGPSATPSAPAAVQTGAGGSATEGSATENPAPLGSDSTGSPTAGSSPTATPPAETPTGAPADLSGGALATVAAATGAAPAASTGGASPRKAAAASSSPLTPGAATTASGSTTGSGRPSAPTGSGAGTPTSARHGVSIGDSIPPSLQGAHGAPNEAQPAALTSAGDTATAAGSLTVLGEATTFEQATAALAGGPPGELDSASYGVGLQQTIETVQATIELAARQGLSQARIALQPEELGEIRIYLTQSASGLVARVTAQTPAAAQALAAGHSELRQSLSSIGLSLTRLDVGHLDLATANGGQHGGGAHERTHGQAPARLSAPTSHSTAADEPQDPETDLAAAAQRSSASGLGGALVDVLV